MADYYPLLAKAVGGLQQSTPDARRAIYERARKALIGQLRAMNPPVPEPDIQRENQALDDAIARIEDGLAPAAQLEAVPPPPPEPTAPPPEPLPAARPETSVAPELDKPLEPSAPARDDAPVPAAPSASVRPSAPILPTGRPDAPDRKPARPLAAPAIPPLPPIPPRPPVSLGKARPVVSSGSGTESAPSADESLSAFVNSGAEPEKSGDIAADDSPLKAEAIRPAAPQPPRQRRGWIRYLIFLALLGLVVGGIALLAWRLRDRPEDLLRARPQAATEQPDGPGKIVERIGGAPVQQLTPQRPATPVRAPEAQSQAAPSVRPVDPSAASAVPVALRAAMLVDAPDDPQKFKTYIGNVVWRLESMSRGPGQPLTQAVRAEADITEARVKVTILLQKNADETLPASHLMTVLFAPAVDSGFPAVDEIDIPQMRNEVSPAVDALMGVPAKITANMFLVGLSRDATFQARNNDMLKSRGWLDIPMRFSDGRIAKVTFEKGPAGDRAIADAFQAWGP